MNDLSYLVPVEQACSHIPTLGLTDSHLPACDSLCWKNTLVRRNHGQSDYNWGWDHSLVLDSLLRWVEACQALEVLWLDSFYKKRLVQSLFDAEEEDYLKRNGCDILIELQETCERDGVKFYNSPSF